MSMRKWQNIIYTKCPDCGFRMLYNTRHDSYVCPTNGCTFFITKKKMLEILSDTTHSAVRYATMEELRIIDRLLREFGIDRNEEPKDMWHMKRKMV